MNATIRIKTRETGVRLTRMCLRVSFLAALFFLTRCELHDWWYYRELREVTTRLEAIPNVEIIHSGGNEDVTFENIYVELNVQGKGRLLLTHLSAGAFTGEQRFFVARIGTLEPQSTFYGDAAGVEESATGRPVKSVGYGGAIEIAGNDPSGCCGELRTVEDVVVHYDDLVRILKTRPRCPLFTERALSNGDVYRFCVSAVGDNSRPPERPEWVWWR